jgi:hypothetical protein
LPVTATIGAGVDPHTVMAFSGHRTPSMLRRYHILNVDDLRTAAARGSAYGGNSGQVIPLAEVVTAQGTRRERGE